ncbi:MAG: hypothetical protein ACOX60_04130 [Massiliimalia sp.]|jgi:uncharacterized protein
MKILFCDDDPKILQQLQKYVAEFFADNHFLVGISVDGTSKTYDAFRLDPNGWDSFSTVMKNIRILERYHVDFNILTVVHAYTAKQIRDIYRFYKAKRFQYLQFIPCLDPMEEEPGKLVYSLTPKAYGEFYANYLICGMSRICSF